MKSIVALAVVAILVAITLVGTYAEENASTINASRGDSGFSIGGFFEDIVGGF